MEKKIFVNNIGMNRKGDGVLCGKTVVSVSSSHPGTRTFMKVESDMMENGKRCLRGPAVTILVFESDGPHIASIRHYRFLTIIVEGDIGPSVCSGEDMRRMRTFFSEELSKIKERSMSILSESGLETED